MRRILFSLAVNIGADAPMAFVILDRHLEHPVFLTLPASYRKNDV